jgi:hypothetical protein
MALSLKMAAARCKSLRIYCLKDGNMEDFNWRKIRMTKRMHNMRYLQCYVLLVQIRHQFQELTALEERYEWRCKWTNISSRTRGADLPKPNCESSSRRHWWLQAQFVLGISYCSVHSPRSGFARPQDSTRINHCSDSANSGCFVERERCERRCTQHTVPP